MKWQVRLVGSEHELAVISRFLMSESMSLSKDKHGQYYLASSYFDSCDTASEVLTVSGEIVSVLNGATKLALGANPGLCESGVLEYLADGTEVFHMHFINTVNVRASCAFTINDADGNIVEKYIPANPAFDWAVEGLRDESVGKVFRLFGQEHGWVDLYRIFEVIEADVGGMNEIVALGWTSKGLLKTFKHTANSPHAVGDNARHGTQSSKPPKKAMLISEARALIETLIHHWLRQKGLV